MLNTQEIYLNAKINKYLKKSNEELKLFYDSVDKAVSYITVISTDTSDWYYDFDNSLRNRYADDNGVYPTYKKTYIGIENIPKRLKNNFDFFNDIMQECDNFGNDSSEWFEYNRASDFNMEFVGELKYLSRGTKTKIEKIKREDYEWIFILKSNSTLCHRDICQLLKVTPGVLDGLIRRGEFPEHTSTTTTDKYKPPKRQWAVAGVIKAIQKLNENIL